MVAKMFESIRELLDHSPMIHNMVKREIRGRYKGSALGFLWNFITPIMQIIVYILVFSIVFRVDIDNYYMYIITGMVPWIFFSDSLIYGSGSIVDNYQLVNKIYFPRSVLPLSVVLSKLVNMLISFGFTFVIIAVTGYGVSWTALLTLVPAIILLFFFTMGLAYILAGLDPYLRDIQYIVNVLMMLLIWMAPLMYTHEQFDNQFFNLILTLNPFTYFCDIFHGILYSKIVPDLMTWVVTSGLSVASIVVGWMAFNKLERDFAEVL